MTKGIVDIANRFLAEETCSGQELADLKRWLSNSSSREEVESWLLENWVQSPDLESETLIETIFGQIETYEKEHRQNPVVSISGILKVYQKIAAFLLIPVIGLGFLYWISGFNQPGTMTETIAPRGQKSQIVLADGTKVWLNSDTKIRYPGNFSKTQRDVYLEGEAFFEVTKNARQPFVVHTSLVNVKVLGTKFNLKAYSDEDHIEASLFEGKINLVLNDPSVKSQVEKEVEPSQSFVYSKINHQLAANKFPKDEINGWKNNRLIFKDDTFSNLVQKVERWYDVKVVYDEKLFNDRRLTVELYEGERLERLMEIISLTLSVDYKYEKGEIILTPKTKNM